MGRRADLAYRELVGALQAYTLRVGESEPGHSAQDGSYVGTALRGRGESVLGRQFALKVGALRAEYVAAVAAVVLNRHRGQIKQAFGLLPEIE
jgi:hypothetical protein